MGKKRGVQILLCVLISILVILISLITSFEIAAYGNMDFYRKEYEKYQVLDALDMEMDDVMDVTEYMMSYLRGKEDVLQIEKVIEGEKQDFFNEQDRLHMEDVRNLFLGGIWLRRGAILLGVGAAVLLGIMKADWKRILPKTFQITAAVFCGIVCFLGIAVAKDFTQSFIIFHEIFFVNDLWMFDSRTDFMIRMLPEGFFFDMVIRIGGIFAILFIALLLVSVYMSIRRKNNK